MNEHRNSTLAAPDASKRLFLLAIVVGLIVRLIVLTTAGALGTGIVDEQHYRALADNLLAGNGFAWGPGALTSLRPPLYPAMMAGLWSVFGADNFLVVRAVQIVLSLLLTWVVYRLGERLYGMGVARGAAAITWLYPSLIFTNVLILTETLFTLLLLAFVMSTIALVQSPRAIVAIGCGVLLGLAALTRSVLWPVPLVLCPLLLVLMSTPLVTRVALASIVLIAYTAIVGPWAARNTRLQEVFTVVDTMGGLNLRMGNYEYTPDERMWDAVSQTTGEKSWVRGFVTDPPGLNPTEGRKDKWAQRKAIEYMVAHPATTMRRALIKFADFWGLEREFIAGVQEGLFSVPFAIAVPIALLIVGAYALIAVAGAAGMWLAPPADWRAHLLLLFPVVLITAAHSIVFGHSRYHLPLMPIFGVYAAALWEARRGAWRAAPAWARTGAASCAILLIAIWLRQILIVDLPRISSLFGA